MRHWWVSQKQTYRHEIAGSYLWSPTRRANGDRNQSYENMKGVAPGDIVYCYWDRAIRAYGSISSFCYEAPKPDEFGEANPNWSRIGYRADVTYISLNEAIDIPPVWDEVRPLLPKKYSPLDPRNGRGLQHMYLAALPEELGTLLGNLIAARGTNRQLVRDRRGLLIASAEEREREVWERHELNLIDTATIASTEREALVKARRGQGLFRQRVASIEQACRVTRVSNPAYLIASHIQPWRLATNENRISGYNGLMLAPHADFLFDRGFISFADGKLLVSPVADEASLLKLGIDPERPPDVGRFSEQQEAFLAIHRAEIFRSADALR